MSTTRGSNPAASSTKSAGAVEVLELHLQRLMTTKKEPGLSERLLKKAHNAGHRFNW